MHLLAQHAIVNSCLRALARPDLAREVMRIFEFVIMVDLRESILMAPVDVYVWILYVLNAVWGDLVHSADGLPRKLLLRAIIYRSHVSWDILELIGIYRIHVSLLA